MTPAMKYAGAGLALVALMTAGLWPFLEQPSRRGVLTAGMIAVPVQVAAFAVLHRYRDAGNRFLMAWAGGMVLRVLSVTLVAVVVVQTGMSGGVALLLALAGFLFVLLLLEPIYLRRGSENVA